MELNRYQTSLEELEVDKCPTEVADQFYDFIHNVPFIRDMISPSRKYAKDLPRDKDGKIIVDVTQPHILEDMDYFRPSALFYKKSLKETGQGKFTNLSPNPNPNSEFGKWAKEEIYRIFNGYIRPSDGEWITGDYYFFLNYCPIQLIKQDPDNPNKSSRVIDFPDVWDGHYLITHYLYQARENGHHAAELASRGKGKSFLGASLLAKRFILGESSMVNRKVQCVVTASERKYLTGANQILDMFQYYIDFHASMSFNTQFPSRRLTSTMQNLQWTMGYLDIDTGARKGTENSVVGITSKDDESKLRGSRGVLYLIEEMGTFPRLLGLYSTLRPSVEDGNKVFGLIFMYGTTGDKDSDFSSAQEIMYNPVGYNVEALPNVYDKEGQGRSMFAFFFGGYMNRAGCYDKDGNSDVTLAILEILKDRYVVKYNSTDINTITKRIAEIPITPQEAILRSKGNMFPVTALNERLNQLDNNIREYDDVYVGTLEFNKDRVVEFKPNSDIPIRDFPLKDNKATGAIEIFKMPEKDREGKVFSNRYIIGHDPVDDDSSNTMSLTSSFVLDLWTDQIVAEYTGRQPFADDNFEIVRKLCLFYNAKCLYENNKKGLFAYMSRTNCLYLLADTPEYLRDKDIIKGVFTGNKSKGVNATAPVNNYANALIRDWLLKPVTEVQIIDGEEQEVTIPNLFRIRNRALIKELILFNPDINVDRVRALGMLMLYREEKMVLYQGDMSGNKTRVPDSYLGNDPFFIDNYERKFSKFSPQMPK